MNLLPFRSKFERIHHKKENIFDDFPFVLDACFEDAPRYYDQWPGLKAGIIVIVKTNQIFSEIKK